MLPNEFKERMLGMIGEEESKKLFDEIENGIAVRSFRVNTIKAENDALDAYDVKIDREEMAFPKGCYRTKEEFPGHLACHHSGMIYMQDPSAMATVHAVKIEKGAKILDSCSAPGGKTTQLAAFAGEDGIVVANEYDTKRCRILQSNVERLGARNTVVVNLDTAVLAETYPNTFDVVLCDAPCSGEGMFRKNSLAVEEWSLENVEMCAERQREILGNVVKCVRDGGKLIYSTCTFSLEENEMNVKWLLDSFPELELCQVSDELKEATSDGILLEDCDYDMTLTRRFYPHVSCGEGQFIAVLAKNADESPSHLPPKKDKSKKTVQTKPNKDELQAIELAREFLDDNLSDGYKATLRELYYYNGSVYLKPNIALPKYGVFAPGVCVGEVVGKRFVPHHQLFSAYGEFFKRKVMLSSSNASVAQYLLGMEISADGFEAHEGEPKGYAAVIVDGCALGGGKISGGVCKNHYPKGLRNQK